MKQASKQIKIYLKFFIKFLRKEETIDELKITIIFFSFHFSNLAEQRFSSFQLSLWLIRTSTRCFVFSLLRVFFRMSTSTYRDALYVFLSRSSDCFYLGFDVQKRPETSQLSWDWNCPAWSEYLVCWHLCSGGGFVSQARCNLPCPVDWLSQIALRACLFRAKAFRFSTRCWLSCLCSSGFIFWRFPGRCLRCALW